MINSTDSEDYRQGYLDGLSRAQQLVTDLASRPPQSWEHKTTELFWLCTSFFMLCASIMVCCLVGLHVWGLIQKAWS